MSLEPAPASPWPSWMHSNGGYARDIGLFTLKPFPLFAKYPLVARGLSYGAVSVATAAFCNLFQWAVERIGFPWFVHGTFTKGDPAFEWVLQYLMEEGVWEQSTGYKVAAKALDPRDESSRFGLGRGKDQHANFMPIWESAKMFRWKGYWLEVKSTEEMTPMGPRYYRGTEAKVSLKITVYSFRLNVLTRFVEHARQCYMALKSRYVIVHSSSKHNELVRRKARRPLDTVILDQGVIQSLIEDIREFLASEEWYTDAGIPHRRGYLLYGPPGTATTIHSIAGELGLEIHSLALGSNQVDDSILQEVASSIPKDGMLLIEDIDCAFPSRDQDGENTTPSSSKSWRSESTVTMSGLLNTLDGVASDEGKLFFATTNYLDRLDPALLRPGRIDKLVEYHLATQQQAHNLFLRWFSIPKADHIVLKASLKMSSEQLQALALEFSSCIPPSEFSTAELQGYLLLHKYEPVSAVEKVEKWVESEREMRRAKEGREKDRKEKA